MSALLQLLGPAVGAVFHVIGLALLAGFVTFIAAFLFRLKARIELPEGPTVLLGLGTVALYLNTRLLFVQVLGDEGQALTLAEALLNVGVFLAAGLTSYGGRSLGHKAATTDRWDWGRLQPGLSPIVRATGRFITVTLPDEVHDIEGYDPVPEETKGALAGETFDFPRGLSLAEVTEQLVDRLKTKHHIGYVDVELDAEGGVKHLAVGQRAVGLGPTLPPGSVAVAVRSDPPFSASPGDTVQVWETGEGVERVGTGELRATVDGNVATIAVDESIAHRIDPEVEHRLMTLSADAYPDREFAAILRRGVETMSIVELTAESSLLGVPVGALDVTVIAVQSSQGAVDTLPSRARPLREGDRVFAIGRPERLRKLATAPGVIPSNAEGLREAALKAFKRFRREREDGQDVTIDGP